MERQSRKICHFIYLYCSRPSGLVPHCYSRLKSLTSFCFHLRSTLRKGDKHSDKLNSFFVFSICLGDMLQSEGWEEGHQELGTAMSDGKYSLLILLCQSIVVGCMMAM